MVVDAPPAHRLVLTAAEWSLLVGNTHIDLPSGFGAEQVDVPALQDAAATLSTRGVVTVDPGEPHDCRPVASVAANLATLAAPTATIRIDVAGGGRGLRALYAFSGPLGASLFALPEGGVELSMFDAQALGRELIRAVPPTEELFTAEARIGAALGGCATGPLAGRLPLAALADYDLARRMAGRDAAGEVAANFQVTEQEAALADQLAHRATGTLRCLVTGAGGDGALVAQVVWIATDTGWVGLQPDPDGSDRQMVALRPVARDDIGVWLAPSLAVILEAIVSDPELHVSGGVGGTSAHFEDIATLARNSDDLAISLAAISAECHAMLADPDVLASALLDPGGVAKFEKTLLGALDGRGGLTALSVGFGQRAINLRVVAASYQAVDAAQAQAIDTVRWAAGRAFAETMPLGPVALAGDLGIPLAAYTLAGGKIDYQRLLTDHRASWTTWSAPAPD